MSILFASFAIVLPQRKLQYLVILKEYSHSTSSSASAFAFGYCFVGY